MRLIKINNIVLNLDRIVVIKGQRIDYDRIKVYAYTDTANSIVLGECENEDDYEKWLDAVYSELGQTFKGEIVPIEDDEELWEK